MYRYQRTVAVGEVLLQSATGAKLQFKTQYCKSETNLTKTGTILWRGVGIT